MKRYLHIEVEEKDGQWVYTVKTDLGEVEYKSVLRKLMFKYPKEKK